MTRIEAEQAARDLLTTTWRFNPDEGICQLPISPSYIAERLGLKVHQAYLEPDVSGMLAKREGQDAEIYVNAGDSEARQRFSCAHELGHYVQRVSGNEDDSFGYIDRRGPTASQGTEPEEIFANQFAAELLMPAHFVRKYAADLGPAGMAAKFGVSVGAMKIRFDTLGL
ncbi:MAG TPA: ImmA/IrrE family metallo-endopeptidase [Conexibacter sp.]|nr:ImmA/IrrE family metallo-endopeptidase [Conexibacter sp.]